MAYNKCGCIYTMDLDESSSVTSMSPLVCGDPNGGDELNECNIDEIANPDNVAYLDGLDVLLIAEDTSKVACLPSSRTRQSPQSLPHSRYRSPLTRTPPRRLRLAREQRFVELQH